MTAMPSSLPWICRPGQTYLQAAIAGFEAHIAPEETATTACNILHQQQKGRLGAVWTCCQAMYDELQTTTEQAAILLGAMLAARVLINPGGLASDCGWQIVL